MFHGFERLSSLRGSFLENAKMYCALLAEADFTDAKMCKTGLQVSWCKNTNFSGANLEGANFQCAWLSDTRFSDKSHLNKTDFRGIYYQDPNDKTRERFFTRIKKMTISLQSYFEGITIDTIQGSDDVRSYLKSKDALFSNLPVSECTLPDILNCNNVITRLQKIEENDYDLLGRV